MRHIDRELIGMISPRDGSAAPAAVSARRSARRCTRMRNWGVHSLSALLLLFGAAPARAATLGMVVDNGSDTVSVFDADTNSVLASLPIGPGSVIGDCAINAAGTRGFVTDFFARVWVVDLTTMPPTMAAGTNPVPITNSAAEDVSLTADGAFAVVCDGSGPSPVSVVDVAAQAEVSTFSLGHDCNSVDVCDDGSVLVTSSSAGTVRRLTIDGGGVLTDTAESLALGSEPNNVVCGPGGGTGFAVTRSADTVISFTIPGLALQDTRSLSGTFGISGVVDRAGTRAYVRDNSGSAGFVDVFSFNPVSGALGATPLLSIPISSTPTFFGMDQAALHPLGHKLYVSQPGALAIYDTTTGGSLGSITHASISAPTGVCLIRSRCGNSVVDAGEDCDDGNVLNGDCCSSTCQYEPNGAPCGSDGLGCTDDVCNGSGACTHSASPSGAVCRASVDLCDLAETCDGTFGDCPADALAPGGVCRPAADVCDAPESCDGGSAACPADGFLNSGECRASAGVCDVAESCDGSGAACPADAKSTAECRASGGDCDVAESCDGVNDDCPVDGFLPTGTLCRPDAGDCDVPDVCTGAGPACPADAKEADGTPCDDASVCTQTDECSAGACVGSDPLDCDDANGCTVDSCDPVGGCENTAGVLGGCRTAAKSLLLLKQKNAGTKDKLIWKWIKGQSTSLDDLDDPQSDAEYALCIYAGTSEALIASATVPPHATKWSPISTKGFKYKDAALAADGIQKVLVKGSTNDKSKALVKGKGPNLPDPVLGAIPYPVIVQLVNNDSGVCLEGSFDAADEIKNTTTLFKVKAQ